MLLHVLSKNAQQGSAFDSCLRAAAPGSVLLLIEDAVYAAVAGSDSAAQIREQDKLRVCILREDIEARGLQDLVIEGLEWVDYAGFVALSTECHAVQSWY